jgi:hypothetical protein
VSMWTRAMTTRDAAMAAIHSNSGSRRRITAPAP